MKCIPRIFPGWLSHRLLAAACLCLLCLAGAGAAAQPDGQRDTRARFVELDGEIQAIKEEILGINREIRLLEELSLYPHSRQLVVLVSVAKTGPVSPDSISLQLDGETISRHHYTTSENNSLHAGGVHRLYSGRLGDGDYSLNVSVTGKLPGGQAFQSQRSVDISSVAGRKYLELHLGPGSDGQDPELTIREY